MAFSAEDQTTTLTISGPRHHLPETLFIPVKLDAKWIDLLNKICKNPISAEDNWAICSTNYNAKARRGWRTESLDEPIRTFMENFKMKKSSYSARLVKISGVGSGRGDAALWLGNQKPSSEANTIVIKSTISDNDKDTLMRLAEKRKRNETGPVPPKTQKFDNAKSSRYPYEELGGQNLFEDVSDNESDNRVNLYTSTAAIDHWMGYQAQGQNVKDALVDDQDCEAEENDDLDVMSQCTADDERDLELEGITVTDLATLAKQRFRAKFSNELLLRAQVELKNLERKGSWVRNVARAPLCCFLLSELLKDESGK